MMTVGRGTKVNSGADKGDGYMRGNKRQAGLYMKQVSLCAINWGV